MDENQNPNPEQEHIPNPPPNPIPNPQAFNQPYNPYDHPDSFFYEKMQSMSWDMRFIGIVSIVYGVIACLSIIGALVGVPIIFAGIRLKDAGEIFKSYLFNNDKFTLSRALEMQSRYFRIQKILIIIAIILTGIYLAVIIFVVSFMGKSIIGSGKWI